MVLDTSQTALRASIITKHNFKEHFEREKKGLESAAAAVPDPFIVTTELKVNNQQVNLGLSQAKRASGLEKSLRVKFFLVCHPCVCLSLPQTCP